MSLITDLRNDLADTCSAATGWVTHAEPPKTFSTPCLLIAHGSPLMEPLEDMTMAQAINQDLYQINFHVVALVQDTDNATTDLETVIDELVPVIKPTSVSEPLVFTYATNNYLGIRFTVTEFANYAE